MDHYEHAGLRFDVRDSGPPQGETVVCLHGFPQDASAYDEVVLLLTERGLRVLAPDQRGYSPGARPPSRSGYALRDLVGDVLALLAAADVDAAHVVGHDWGGAVAWALAGRHPGRVRSLTVLSTPHPAALRATALRSTQAARSSYMAFFQLPWLPEALALARDGLILRAALTRSGLPEDKADQYVGKMCAHGALSSALGWYRSLPASLGYGAGRITVPTSYVWGNQDPFFARQAAERTRDHVVGPYDSQERDCGHWLPETQPRAVADAVLRTRGLWREQARWKA